MNQEKASMRPGAPNPQDEDTVGAEALGWAARGTLNVMRDWGENIMERTQTYRRYDDTYLMRVVTHLRCDLV